MTDKDEWQPRLLFPTLDDEVKKTVLNVKLTLCGDIDLTTDVLGIELWQEGNLISTEKQPGYANDRVNSVYMRVTMTGPNGFSEKWHMHGAWSTFWDCDVKKIF